MVIVLLFWKTTNCAPSMTSSSLSITQRKPNRMHSAGMAIGHSSTSRQNGVGGWDIPVTIIAVMMKSNYLRLADVARVAKQFDAPLRVNVYQAVRSDIYALSYEEYWEGFRRLFAETDVIAIGEPLVRAMAGLPPLRGGCGVSTVRVTPRATTQPCVYWPGMGEPLSDLISMGPDILDSAPSSRPGHFPTRASLASSASRATADVPDGGACKAHCYSLILIVRSFGASAHDSRSAWPQIAICPS